MRRTALPLLFLVFLLPLSAVDMGSVLSGIEADIREGGDVSSLIDSYRSFLEERDKEVALARKESDSCFARKRFDESKLLDGKATALEALGLSPDSVSRLVSLIISQDGDEERKIRDMVWLSQVSGWEPQWFYRVPETGEIRSGGTFLPYQRIPLVVEGLPPFVGKWRRADGSFVRSGSSFVPDVTEREVLCPVFSLSIAFHSVLEGVDDPPSLVWDGKTQSPPVFPSANGPRSALFLGWEAGGRRYGAGERIPFEERTYRGAWACPRLEKVETVRGENAPGALCAVVPVLSDGGNGDDGSYRVTLECLSPSVRIEKGEMAVGVLGEGSRPSDALRYRIGGDVPVGEILSFTLSIRRGDAHVWRFPYRVEVCAPTGDLVLDRLEAVENPSPSLANQDGLLESGETGTLRCHIANVGSGKVSGTLRFSSGDSRITFLRDRVSVTDLEGGGKLLSRGDVAFRVSSGVVDGTVPVTVTYDDGTRVWSETKGLALSSRLAGPQVVLAACRPVGKERYISDGKVRRGESYEVVPLVRNVGQSPLLSAMMYLDGGADVSVKGRYGLPGLQAGSYCVLGETFSDGNEAVALLRSRSFRPSPLVFTVPADAVVGDPFPLSLCFEDTYGNRWEEPLSLTVGASAAGLSLSYFAARTERGGSSAGETRFLLDAVLVNSGSSPLLPCTVRLCSPSGLVSCDESVVRVGDMVPEGMGFSLSGGKAMEIVDGGKALACPAEGLSFTVKGYAVLERVPLSLIVSEEGGEMFAVDFVLERK